MVKDNDVSTTERYRYLVASNTLVVVVLCLLVTAAAGFVLFQAWTSPETTTEQRTVTTWTTDGRFDHAAVVQRDVRAFENGSVLRNRSLYFSRVAPVLNGSYTFEHGGEVDPATVRTDLRLVVRAIETGEQESVLWRITESLETRRTDSLAPGDPHRVPFSFNVSRQAALARNTSEQLGSTRGTVEVLVVARIQVGTTAEGEPLSETRTDRLVITPQTSSYGVERDVAESGERPVTQSVTVPVESDPVRRFGSLAGVLLGLLSVTSLMYLSATGRLGLPPDKRTIIEHRSERNEFDEWISVGRVPDPPENVTIVTVESLPDLVDVAIDSNRRVIDDRDANRYVVLDGETRYVYTGGTDSVDEGASDLQEISEPDSGSTGDDTPD